MKNIKLPCRGRLKKEKRDVVIVDIKNINIDNKQVPHFLIKIDKIHTLKPTLVDCKKVEVYQ